MVIHWLTLFVVIGLFSSGLWMVELDYYSSWYHRAPELHKATGVLLLMLTLFRLIWRLTNSDPAALQTHTPLERQAGRWVHRLLYLLLFLIMASGYFISTAEGDAIDVFEIFSLPATIYGYEGQADIAGEIHFILASILIGMALLHAGAAIKHHFIDRDNTLRRMLPLTLSQPPGE